MLEKMPALFIWA